MTTEIKVGIFAIVVMIIFAYFSTNVGFFTVPWEKQGQIYTVKINDVSGLERGAAVRIAGVRKGVVDEIALEENAALVTMRLDPDVILREGASAQVGSMGMMGEKFLDVNPGKLGAETINDGQRIDGVPSASIEQLIKTLNTVGEDIKAITEVLRSSVSGEGDANKIKNIVDNIDRITTNVDRIVGKSTDDVQVTVENIREISTDLKRFINDNAKVTEKAIQNFQAMSSEMRNDVPALVAKLNKIADRLDVIIADNQQKVDGTVDNIKTASEDLKASLDKVKSITTKIDEGEGTIGKLINDPQTHDQINKVMVSVQETADGARKFLNRMTKIETAIGYRGEYLSDHSDTKSYISFRLRTRPEKFFMLDLVHDPFGKVTEQDIYTRTETTRPGQPTDVVETREHREKRDDDFLISAQIGRRFHDFTIRGGMIESSGGVGADYDLFNDRLRFSFDVWDFGEDEMDPHLKV